MVPMELSNCDKAAALFTRLENQPAEIRKQEVTVDA